MLFDAYETECGKLFQCDTTTQDWVDKASSDWNPTVDTASLALPLHADNGQTGTNFEMKWTMDFNGSTALRSDVRAHVTKDGVQHGLCSVPCGVVQHQCVESDMVETLLCVEHPQGHRSVLLMTRIVI